MNANCIICSDLFQPRSDIYATSCGHLFHFLCLIQWIERSKTCPQCRHKETEKTIHRIFFNLISTENVPDDIVTLQAKLDNENFQLKLKEKARSNYLQDYKKCNTNSRELSDITIVLQQTTKANKLAMRQMKEQLHYFKDKLKDKEKYAQEVKRLHSEMENMKHIRTVVDGSEEEVKDIIRGCRDPKTLCLFVTILQKELKEQDRKKQKLSAQLRLNKSDLNEAKAQEYFHKQKYEELKSAQEAHKSCPAKIAALKEKLTSILEDGDQLDPNDSVNRVVMESPAPLRHSFNQAFIDLTEIKSPTVNQRIAQIKASDSPYLTLKSTVGNQFGHLLQAKYKVQPKCASAASTSETTDKYSIFSKKIASTGSIGDYSYNGLGGHSKNEMFPQPKPGSSNSSVKRTKSASSLKFKKLNPTAISAFSLQSKKK